LAFCRLANGINVGEVLRSCCRQLCRYEIGAQEGSPETQDALFQAKAFTAMAGGGQLFVGGGCTY
jgi:hypothetical protein